MDIRIRQEVMTALSVLQWSVFSVHGCKLNGKRIAAKDALESKKCHVQLLVFGTNDLSFPIDCRGICLP